MIVARSLCQDRLEDLDLAFARLGLPRPAREYLFEKLPHAQVLLQDNNEALKRIAEALLEYETLEAEDVNVLIQGGVLTRERPPPRVTAPPPKQEKKDKRKILDALEGLPKMEPNKA